jgi:hypothetical protein
MHGGEALALERSGRGLRPAQLPADDLRRHRVAALAVAPAHLGRRRVEDDGMGRHAVALGELAPRAAALGLEAGGVDDGRQPAPQPLGHDQVEDLERVAAGALVALGRADDGAQAVRGDDLVGVEPLRRPLGLARPAGADQHDEARVGEAQRRGVEQRLGHAAGPTTAAAFGRRGVPARRRAGGERRLRARKRTNRAAQRRRLTRTW